MTQNQNYKRRKRTVFKGFGLGLLALLVSTPGIANAQEEFGIQGANIVINGNDIFQMNQNGNGKGTRFSQSRRNGQSITTLTQDGMTIKVTQSNDALQVDVKRTYTSADQEDLKKDHPKVAKAMAAFPSESRESFVDLKVTLSRTFEAIDPEDLKEESKEGFKYYQKVQEYQKKNRRRGGFRFGGGIGPDMDEIFERQERMMERMLEDARGLRVRPGRIQIRPRQKEDKPKRKIKGIAT